MFHSCIFCVLFLLKTRESCWAVTNFYYVCLYVRTLLCNDHVIITGDNIPDVYTVEEAVDKLGFGAFQVLISLFAGVIWVMK